MLVMFGGSASFVWACEMTWEMAADIGGRTLRPFGHPDASKPDKFILRVVLTQTFFIIHQIYRRRPQIFMKSNKHVIKKIFYY
jgi:hypothetical protein